MHKSLFLPLIVTLLIFAAQGPAFAQDSAIALRGGHETSTRVPAVPPYRGSAGRTKAAKRLSRLGLREPRFVRSAHGRFVFTVRDAFGRTLTLTLDPRTLKVVGVRWPQDSVGLTERDVVRQLARRGYNVEHIDRRGEVYFVRAERDGNLYHGYIRGGDGTWLGRVCERANAWTRSPGSDRCQRKWPTA